MNFLHNLLFYFFECKVKDCRAFLVVGQKNKSNTLIFILLIISSLQKWFN